MVSLVDQGDVDATLGHAARRWSESQFGAPLNLDELHVRIVGLGNEGYAERVTSVNVV